MNDLKAIVTDHPFFRQMKPEHLAIITEGATEQQFKPGQIMFHEGKPANQFYIIETGKVALEIHEGPQANTPVETLGNGDVLGWSWLFPPFVWHFQARVLEPTKVVALSGAHLLVQAERDHEFGFELMKRVTQVVIHRLQTARRQLLARPASSPAS